MSRAFADLEPQKRDLGFGLADFALRASSACAGTSPVFVCQTTRGAAR